ncbi:hypothetical protein B0H14DRAFT_3526748 [Mycena olivaceomarginata]|nr:hypothetical protein B0H14DRAFT_3526748 [Mycena olivaceomarginata]
MSSSAPVSDSSSVSCTHAWFCVHCAVILCAVGPGLVQFAVCVRTYFGIGLDGLCSTFVLPPRLLLERFQL